MREAKSNLPWYFKRKSAEDIFNTLEVIETNVLTRKPIRWNVVRVALSAMKVTNKTSPYCLNFAIELFRLFERQQCKDVNIIAEVFLLMFFLTADNLRFYGAKTLVDSVLEENIVRTPYGEMRKFFSMPYDLEQNKMDLVWQVARRGNLSLLKLQLKFGMGMMIPRFDATSCSAYVEQLLLLSRCDVHRQDREKIKAKICRNFDFESEKRLFFVLRMVEIFLKIKQYPEYREHFTGCYSLIMDSVPEAYVGIDEVKSSLEKCFPDRCFKLISKLTVDFKRLLPKVSDTLQPRSLQQLCRIQVRQSLRQKLNLPHGVSSLQLPTILKKYIMLNDDGDYSVMILTTLDQNWETDCISSPSSFAKIPERDDCVISFVKRI